ncbi:phosphatase PAP2 family protein [Helicobacter pylori]|uniref:phosphatase PAP2 family protein n=1 Tax=Helicobacter pylori TaxID=210 RepID=UPI00165B0E82|nr:phosphatase PAP2 family protein [Helicobacter pylori]WQS21239.1 phosphatase PAP2 family protein [Helicobacter pylori]WQS30578.1 phosphatase PAP2 family protein [Helicobacter pylori]
MVFDISVREKKAAKALGIVGVVFFILFGIIISGVAFQKEWVQQLDLFFIDLIRNPTPIQGSAWLSFVLLSTWFAQSKLTTSIALLISLWFGFQKRIALALWFFPSILLGEITLKLLKHLVARPRPATNGELALAHGFSFPSGHALASALFYGSLALLLCCSNANNRIKTIGAIILLFWIFLMAYDRVYLGVHYPSDVLGGFLLGIAWSCCSLALYLGFLKRPYKIA